MKASILVEPGVPDVAIGAARIAVDVLGSNLPASFGGLQSEVERFDSNFPSSSIDRRSVEASFIESAPPWGDESLNVFVTNRPLSLGGEALHGYAVIGKGIAIVSGARLDRGNRNEPLELLAVTLHESGHAFGLVSPNKARYDRVTQHCGNLCIMGSGAEREPIDVAKLALGARGVQGGFCGGCKDDLGRLYIAP